MPRCPHDRILAQKRGVCTHPTLFQDPEIDGELEGQREVRGREHHWAAGTRSKLSPGDQEPPSEQLTERGQGSGSDTWFWGEAQREASPGVPPTLGKGPCAWLRREPWERVVSWEPGKAYPIPLVLIESNKANFSWLIPFPQCLVVPSRTGEQEEIT